MTRPKRWMVGIPAFILIVALLVTPALAADGTTELRIAKYAADRTTVLNETTVDYRWLEANLPIQGDGVTRYYHQGPVFEGHWEETHPGEPYDGWNPAEDVLMSMLVKADLGAVKGTDFRDICNYIGGAEEGDEIAIRSRDGFQKIFPYEYIYEPDSRQGPAVLCWYSGNGSGPDAQEAQGQGYPDTGYVVGMRLVFFADDATNPWGWHIFGNNDMRECWAEDDWNKGGDYWSAAGTSAKWVNQIRIYSQEEPPEPPIADFTANVTEGGIPLAVKFTDTSEGDPTSWSWDFGDGATSAEQNPVHTYTAAGTYTVTLTVANIAGSDSTETTVNAGTVDLSGRSNGDPATTEPPGSDNLTFFFEVPGIDEIVVFAAEIPPDLNLSCEEVRLPAGIPEPPGEVYRYYNITADNGTVAINRTVIRFNVPDAWMQENWIVNDDLALYRYNGTWTVLETGWIGTENDTNTYEAISPGFSLFAVSGLQTEPTSFVTTAPTATPLTTQITPTGTATPAVTGTPTIDDGIPKNPFMLAFGYMAAPPVGGLPGRLFGAVQAFLGLFGLLPAMVADPVTEPEPVQAAPTPPPAPTPTPLPVDLTTMRFNLLVLSDPPGALIDLDGEYTGRTTPAAFASLSGGNHSVRVRLDGAEPVEQAILFERDDEVVIEVPGPASSRSASPGLLRGREQNHYGGVYIDSSPQEAEIFVDGRKVNRKTPAVIYGLREGLHAIRVQKEGAAFSSEGEQVWIEKNTVARMMFAGGNPELTRSIAFESEEYAKQPFSVNGRYLGDRFPKTVEVAGIAGSYLTVSDGESYRTYRIPATAGSGDTVNAGFSAASCGLLVTSTPAGAAISIDGLQTGFATPYLVGNISEGRHLVRVSKPGYIPAEREVLLAAGSGDASAKFTIEPYAYGSLSVSSTPPDARIYLFGRDTGERTPHIFHYLPIGSYSVRIVGGNGTVTIEDVMVVPYQTTECRAELPEI